MTQSRTPPPGWRIGNDVGLMSTVPSHSLESVDANIDLIMELLAESGVERKYSDIGFLDWPFMKRLYVAKVENFRAFELWDAVSRLSIGSGLVPVLFSPETLPLLCERLQWFMHYDADTNCFEAGWSAYSWDPDKCFQQTLGGITNLRWGELDILDGGWEPRIRQDGSIVPMPEDIILLARQIDVDHWGRAGPVNILRTF